jgi:hypothetical protein
MFTADAGWQVFKQLLMEGKHGADAAVATDAAAAARSADIPSSTSSRKEGDTGSGSSDSSIKALQEQVRKLQLQVRSSWHCMRLPIHLVVPSMAHLLVVLSFLCLAESSLAPSKEQALEATCAESIEAHYDCMEHCMNSVWHCCGCCCNCVAGQAA